MSPSVRRSRLEPDSGSLGRAKRIACFASWRFSQAPYRRNAAPLDKGSKSGPSPDRRRPSCDGRGGVGGQQLSVVGLKPTIARPSNVVPSAVLVLSRTRFSSASLGCEANHAARTSVLRQCSQAAIGQRSTVSTTMPASANHASSAVSLLMSGVFRLIMPTPYLLGVTRLSCKSEVASREYRVPSTSYQVPA